VWVPIVLCLAHLPVLLGGIVFSRDPAHWIFPARWLLRTSLLQGQVPVWNPYQALGFPIFANPLYGVFYPPNWLYLLAGPGWVASLQTWQDLAHLAWGAGGVFWLARRLRVAPLPALVAALAWGLSGYTTAQWTAGLRLQAGAWLPWVGLGHLHLLARLRAGGRGWTLGVVVAALPTALGLLLGEVFVAAMGLFFALATTAAVVVSEPQEPMRSVWRWRWLAPHGLAVALAGGAAAATLVPSRALMASSERAGGLSRVEAEEWSLHPARLIELAAPDSMGNSRGFAASAATIGEERLGNHPLSNSVYLGASVLALALLAPGRRRRLGWLCAALALFAVLLALGRFLPVHGLWRRLALPMAYMRYPEKYLVLAVAWLALMAALGAERLLAPGPWPWRRIMFLLAALLALALLAPLGFPADWAGHVRAGALHGSLAVAGVLAARLVATRRPRLGAGLLVGVVALDLATAIWPLHEFVPRELAVARSSALPVVLAHRGQGKAPPRLYRSHKVSPAVERFVPAADAAAAEARLVQTFITNTANVWGVATVPGYDAAIPSQVDRIWENNLASGQSVLRLFGVDYAVLPVDDPRGREKRTGIEPLLDPLPGARLYRVPGTLPRVYLAGAARLADDAQALARILEPEITSGAVALLAPERGAAPLPGPAGRAGTCMLEAYAGPRLTARCQAERPAVAVFVEQFDPGWRAEVDGRPAPILRANVLMRAVALEPGAHEITMRYHTPGLRLGAGLSILSALALLALGLVGRRRPTPQDAGPRYSTAALNCSPPPVTSQTWP
jgi:hypothetical protein